MSPCRWITRSEVTTKCDVAQWTESRTVHHSIARIPSPITT